MGRMRSTPVPAAGGFSLVEALLAASVLAVGVLSLAHLFIVATRANASAARTSVAAIMAAQKVEELRARHTFGADDGVDQAGEFTRRWTVTPYAADPANTVLIDVRVTPGGVRLVTLRTRRAP